MDNETSPLPLRVLGTAAALLGFLACGGSSSPGPYDLANAVALGDFNGDGRLDVVSALATHGRGAPHPGFLSFRFQNASGNPRFQDPMRQDVGTDPAALAVGDLNGDGRPDLVVANTQSLPDPIQANAITVLLSGSAPGSFLPTQQLSVGNRDPLDVAIGDLNGDGRPDIAVAARGANSVLIFFQTAAGSFATPVAVPVGGEPTALAVADLNGDGRADLAVTTLANTVSVLLQTATPGTFAAAVDYPGLEPPNALRASGLDWVCRPDLAVANWASTTAGLSVLRQNPMTPGVFLAAANYDTGDWYPSALALGDLNGDGRPDLVVTNAGAPGFTGSVAVFLQDPSAAGTFQSPTLYLGYSGPTSVAIGDLDGDGKPDLVLADGSPSVRFQDPAHPGSFLPPVWLRH